MKIKFPTYFFNEAGSLVYWLTYAEWIPLFSAPTHYHKTVQTEVRFLWQARLTIVAYYCKLYTKIVRFWDSGLTPLWMLTTLPQTPYRLQSGSLNLHWSYTNILEYSFGTNNKL